MSDHIDATLKTLDQVEDLIKVAFAAVPPAGQQPQMDPAMAQQMQQAPPVDPAAQAAAQAPPVDPAAQAAPPAAPAGGVDPQGIAMIISDLSNKVNEVTLKVDHMEEMRKAREKLVSQSGMVG